MRLQLGLQTRQGLQAAHDAGIHERAYDKAQQQKRHDHVKHQLTRDTLTHREALGYLHTQALRACRFAKLQFNRGNAQWPRLHAIAIDHRLVELRIGAGLQAREDSWRWLGQLGIAQDELPRWAGDHIAHLVFGIFFNDGLRRFRKINQEPRSDGLDLPRKRAHRLRQRLINALLGIRERDAISQAAADQPEQQLRQQKPQQ